MLEEEEYLRRELENSSDINSLGSLGFTPLLLACMLRNEKAIETILDFKPAMNIKSSCNKTALSIFVRSLPPNELLLRRFLEEGADPNIADDIGRTALHFVFYRGQFEKIEEYISLLLQYKADVHSKDIYGHTPLHEAILRGSHGSVRILLKNGALTNNKNFQDKTELELAVLHKVKFPRVMKIISEYIILRHFFTNQVDPVDLNLICAIEEISRYKDECNSELEASKCITLGDSTVTCYDIFLLRPKDLAKKLRYRNVPISMMKIDKESYPIFGDYLAQNLQYCVERVEAVDRGYEFLRKLCPDIPTDCIEKIVSFLANTDLMRLRLV
ncbi:hypothetical protein WA026_016237 [Henosepilachna vigintioctopunctata]